MDDYISRKETYDKIDKYFGDLPIVVHHDMLQIIKDMPSAQQCEYWDSESNYCALNRPSAQPDVHDRNVGEWDMFELITSTWYGKQCYFMEDNGIVYSRVSCKHMSVDDAIKEFLWRIGDNG